MNEQAIWKLAAKGGMAALTIDQLAQETGQSPLDLASLYPEPAFMVLVIIEEIHSQTMATRPPSDLTIQDRLTDRVMSHLDACLPHREAIRRLSGDLISMPWTLLTLRPYLMKMVARILKECELDEPNPGISPGASPESSLWAPIRLRAYFALFLYVLYVWIYDDTPQQEHTLVTLDRGLKQLEALPW